MSDGRPAGVLVAIVLYDQHLDQVWRCCHALTQALRLAQQSGRLSAAGVAIGDCSVEPVLDANASSDLIAHAKSQSVSLDYRWFGANLGHSGGSNELVAGAISEALLFANPDTYCSPTSINCLVDRLSDPTVGAVDARQIPCEHPKAFDPTTGDQAWASGSFLLVRRSAFEQIGGFDTAFFTYGNDVDLSWRLRLCGYRIVHEPRSVIFHDKRLDVRAHVVPTKTELRSGLLARLLLAHKYDRPDIVEDTLREVKQAQVAEHLAAVRDYRNLVESGRVPPPLAAASSVAAFSPSGYGPRRF